MVINFFNKKSENNNKKNKNKLVLVCALLVHAAKMDENYTEKERQIILKALSMISVDNQDKLKLILSNAEKKENESNQILEFTKEIKKYEKNFRLKIIEILWKIIYSDGISDMYESSLMRRLNKLLYVSDKESANIKQAVIMDIKK